MARLVRATAIGELGSSHGVQFEDAGPAVAVFSVDGTPYAIGGTCPHRAGPLGEGRLEGTVVTCPWHGWRFDVTTGRCLSHATACVPVFEARVDGGDVILDLP